MAGVGYERIPEEEDPEEEEKKEEDDDDDDDSTFPGQPNGSSTPASGQTRTHLPTERSGYTTAQTSFIEDIPPPSTTDIADAQLKKEFPNADITNLRTRINTKNDRLEVSLLKSGEKTYYLTTKILGSEDYQINPKLPKKILNLLGKSRRETIAEEMQKLSAGINENKKIAGDEKESPTERNKARERAKSQIAKRTDLNNELKKLKSGVTLPLETIPLEEFQQNQEERRERQKEIQQDKEKQEELANDENEDPAVRQQAREKIDELDIEDNQIENENEREIERLPFRERAKVKLKNAREKIKEFFKKNGVTLLSITIAAGITIGVVTDILTDALKSMGKALGNGLKAIAKKTASLLPGLIGSIVSFLFKAAGQAIGFLAEHTWLLILAVVAFLVEGQIKKQR